MAFSKALMRIDLSMPFSLLTCSMTRLRSCCILSAPIVIVIRLFNHGKWNLITFPFLRQNHAVLHDLAENSQKGPPAIDQIPGANTNSFTHKSRKMRGFFERSIDPGG